MPRLDFDFIGDAKVGDCYFESRANQMTISLNGELITSGCAEAALVRAIGVDAIVRSLDANELLDRFSDDDLIDYLVNSDRSNEAIRIISQAISGAFN